MQPYMRFAWSPSTADKAIVRFLNFMRFRRASGLGRVSLASQRQTVDADTPSRCANSAWDSWPLRSRISFPVIAITSRVDNNHCAAR